MRAAAVWLAIGLLFLLSPGELDGDGLLKSLGFTLFVVLALTPPAVYYAILKALPERAEIGEVSVVDVPVELDRLCEQYERMGFRRVLTPLRIKFADEAVLVAMMSDDGVMATAYRIIARDRSKIGHDVVSMLDAPDGSLTTATDPAAGVLPAPDGALRQILEDASPEDMVLFHRQAIEVLEGLGVNAVGVTPSAIPGLLRRSIARSRHKLEAAPVKNTLIAIWRTVTKRNPHLGMLAEQEGLETLCESLRTGARAHPVRTGRRPMATRP